MAASLCASLGSAAFQAACQRINEAMVGVEDERHQLVAAKCRALMLGYDARWASAEWAAIELEQTNVLPIVNPTTGRASRTWQQAGKQDGVIEGYGKTALLEHKTTSEDIADPNATYWRRLAIDSQVSKYMLQSWQKGLRLDGTLYDVIRKPSIRPKRLTNAERKDLIVSRTYLGQPVDDLDILAEISAGQEQECLTLYSIRLALDTIENPDRYFQRRMIPRLDGEIVEYAFELWDIGQEILRARSTSRHYRNPDACMQYGRACEYLGICSGHEAPESDRWEHVDAVHGELDGIEGDGRSILTNSRIRCFQLCRRKHHYRYELGLRRRDDEDGEALYFGHLFHQALETWWARQKGNVNGHSEHSSSAATEVAEHAQA